MALRSTSPPPSLWSPHLRPPAGAFNPRRRVALINSLPLSLATQLKGLVMRDHDRQQTSGVGGGSGRQLRAAGLYSAAAAASLPAAPQAQRRCAAAQSTHRTVRLTACCRDGTQITAVQPADRSATQPPSASAIVPPPPSAPPLPCRPSATSGHSINSTAACESARFDNERTCEFILILSRRFVAQESAVPGRGTVGGPDGCLSAAASPPLAHHVTTAQTGAQRSAADCALR